MTNKRFIIAVPARLESKRLPNKLLADIGGMPMIQRVLQRCSMVKEVTHTVLITDSDLLISNSALWGFTSIQTSSTFESGTDRIASVCRKLVAKAWDDETILSDIDKYNIRLNDTFIINVQGDQPFLDPTVIEDLISVCKSEPVKSSVITPIYSLKDKSIHDPNVVKVILASDQSAIYFSRSPLPHVRDVSVNQWHLNTKYWGHVGIYGYNAKLLSQWNKLSPSILEQSEKLEQLRLLENGYKINTFKIDYNILSIDTKEQLDKARSIV